MITSSFYVEKVARDWIGTPYRHQASTKHLGADCLGLVRGIWRELYGEEPETPPAYTADWSEAAGEERLWHAARRNLTPVEQDIDTVGDIVLFRMRSNVVAKHMGILAKHSNGFPSIIHAFSGRGVLETPMTPSWRRRAVAQFRFPVRRV